MLNEKELKKQVGVYDFVLLSDVFEHSIQPTKLIDDLFLLLKANGLLIIATGNADARSAKFDLADYWYFRTIQHLCMLGETYISFLVKRLDSQLYAKVYCSHYNGNVFIKLYKKIIYVLRFIFYKYVSVRKTSFAHKLFKYIPVLNKITRWYTQPYYPYFKDHIVFAIKKNG